MLVSYVVWKMARFDPDWMSTTVEDAVERSVGEQIGAVQRQVDAVEERVGRRPREDGVE